MSHIQFTRSILFLFMGVVPFWLSAEESAVIPPEEETPTANQIEPVRIRIYTLPMRGILTENSTFSAPPPRLISEHSIHPEVCSLSRNSYSDTLHLIPGKRLRLVEPGAEEEPKTVYLDQEVPAGSRNLVGILDPVPHPDTGKPTLELFSVSESETPFEWHTFFNGLPHVIEIKLGTVTHNLTPGKSLSIKASEQRERIYITELAGKRSRIYTGAVYKDGTRGRLHLIRPRQNSTRRIDVLSLSGPEQAAQDPEEVSKP